MQGTTVVFVLIPLNDFFCVCNGNGKYPENGERWWKASCLINPLCTAFILYRSSVNTYIHTHTPPTYQSADSLSALYLSAGRFSSSGSCSLSIENVSITQHFNFITLAIQLNSAISLLIECVILVLVCCIYDLSSTGFSIGSWRRKVANFECGQTQNTHSITSQGQPAHTHAHTHQS